MAGGSGGMGGFAGGMGGMGGMGMMMPPSGGRHSIYGGSNLAGTGFDPRAADAIAAVDAAREAERRASTPRVEYVPASGTATTSSAASQGGEGYITRGEFRPVVGELMNQNRRLRAVEQRTR